MLPPSALPCLNAAIEVVAMGHRLRGDVFSVGRHLVWLALALALWGAAPGAHGNPGLLSAIGKSSEKLQQVLGWFELDSAFVSR